jgi:hypothetical protein
MYEPLPASGKYFTMPKVFRTVCSTASASFLFLALAF